MTGAVWQSFCFTMVVLVATIVSGQTSAPPRTDTQIWNDVHFSVPLSKTVDFTLLGVLRFGRNVRRPVDERLGVAFSFKAGKYVTFTSSYLNIGMQPFQGRSVFENRLSFATTVRFPLGRFTLSDRNLFERRLRHPGGDSTRYRNKLQIEHPIGSPKIKLNVFVSEEIFYDWSFNAWVRNRFGIGVTKSFNKHVAADLFYMRQNDSHSFPGDLHILGTAWRFKL
jgi:hypothetical protein